jgi:hypothetical protein
MVAADNATVVELNRWARRDRVAAGRVAAEGLHVAAGQSAGIGDQVITRQNDRTLTTGRGWVKTGVAGLSHALARMVVCESSGQREERKSLYPLLTSRNMSSWPMPQRPTACRVARWIPRTPGQRHH